jgi:DNA invertase Pin-like site-specific DNA recombinase
MVLHSCDVTNCVNPAHLRLGTAKENTKDMVDRGRDTSGEKSSLAKLTELQIEQAESMWRSGQTQASIAKRLGLSQSTLSRAFSGDTWKRAKLKRG